jgi:hypothetical protein
MSRRSANTCSLIALASPTKKLCPSVIRQIAESALLACRALGLASLMLRVVCRDDGDFAAESVAVSGARMLLSLLKHECTGPSGISASSVGPGGASTGDWSERLASEA